MIGKEVPVKEDGQRWARLRCLSALWAFPEEGNNQGENSVWEDQLQPTSVD